MPTLRSVSGWPDIPLDHPLVLVGRHPRCDVYLASVRVSRRHCIIAAEDGEVVVPDLGSTYGTWINGRRVASGRIRPGDEVAHLRYCLEEPPTRCTAGAGMPSHPAGPSDSPRSSDVPE